MHSIYMIFTALATTTLAKGSIECNFSEPAGARCFGIAGQPLLFHLTNTANPDIRLTKDDKFPILKVKNHNVTQNKEYVNHFAFFTNGTFKLGNAMKKHSGDYLLTEHGSDGVLLRNVTVHLEIQVPVSKPAVSQMCLSPEQMNISCSAEGDRVEFILTLDSFLLMQTRGNSQSPSSSTMNTQSPAGSKTGPDKASVSTITISLNGQLTGNLMCQVWNNVGKEETVIQLKRCQDVPFSVVTVAASVVTLLLLGGLCLGIIKLYKTQTRPTINEDNTEDEIIYTTVRVIRNSHQNAT
ncbi:uncharacterized protein LOC109139802 [Larimichthys crocea]|uniref:uncharacterized protein LOC109139802 n=1 Tax=Larimichthys crocea TaxID=215358 RepID=UPI000F5F075A|nr:uncharacterized protein LOC109139802 [Larimichthys crocea]